jgi:hypothetical protein
MADFTETGVALARALGKPDSWFFDAYASNRADTASSSLDDSVLAEPLRGFLSKAILPWEGTLQELLDGLAKEAGDLTKSKGWPGKPGVLSGMLRRIAPLLRGQGIEVDLEGKDPRTRRRLVRLTRCGPEHQGNSPFAPSEPFEQPENKGNPCEGSPEGCEGSHPSGSSDPSHTPSDTTAETGSSSDEPEGCEGCEGAVAPPFQGSVSEATPEARAEMVELITRAEQALADVQQRLQAFADQHDDIPECRGSVERLTAAYANLLDRDSEDFDPTMLLAEAERLDEYLRRALVVWRGPPGGEQLEPTDTLDDNHEPAVGDVPALTPTEEAS